MQQAKMTTIICLVLLVTGVIGYVIYIELFAIPAILTRQFGQLATLIHILGVLFLVVGWGEVRGWLQSRHIFTTQRELVTPHLNEVIDAIENLAVGRWKADSDTYAKLIDTGARMGFVLGKAVSSELDRNQIEAGIAGMALPEPKQAAGQSTDEVGKMREYMDSLDARKSRLSE
jgi:hypothetical protein